MALCPSYLIDSNITGLRLAEEECLRDLPNPETNTVWYGHEPNSYADFGGELTTLAREPIDPSRQNKKGAITDLDASGGFNEDVTQHNMTRLMQGFMFADAREMVDTQPLNGTAVPITNVANGSSDYQAASGLDAFAAGMLVLASGFAVAANNGLKTVGSAAAGSLVVNEGTTDEAAPPAEARLQEVGVQFATGDVAISFVGGTLSLTSTVYDFTANANIFPGQWVFLGGDGATNAFNNNVPGYARIASITANALVFDDVTWTPVTEPGAGLDIQMFFGTTVKNEGDPALIKRRSYHIERTLGNGPFGNPQAEYLIGAIPNEFTLNMAQADKINADLSFVALDEEFRTGEAAQTPPEDLKQGTRVPGLAEDAFNTTSDVYRMKMYEHDPNDPNPSPLFAFVTEATITISNGVTPQKAISVLGALDTSTANFTANGTLTAYFVDVRAKRAIRNNADITVNFIVAARNAGHVWDIPLVSLGGGRITVEKDAPITIPLDSSGAENELGYTASYTDFYYLPDAAMP